MIRLYLNRRPMDGGSVDLDGEPSKSKKAAARGDDVRLPDIVYVSCGNVYRHVWVYRLTRVITHYSAEYRLTRWVNYDNIDDNAVLVFLCT